MGGFLLERDSLPFSDQQYGQILPGRECRMPGNLLNPGASRAIIAAAGEEVQDDERLPGDMAEQVQYRRLGTCRHVCLKLHALLRYLTPSLWSDEMSLQFPGPGG